jgi:hypothetical protein
MCLDEGFNAVFRSSQTVVAQVSRRNSHLRLAVFRLILPHNVTWSRIVALRRDTAATVQIGGPAVSRRPFQPRTGPAVNSVPNQRIPVVRLPTRSLLGLYDAIRPGDRAHMGEMYTIVAIRYA